MLCPSDISFSSFFPVDHMFCLSKFLVFFTEKTFFSFECIAVLLVTSLLFRNQTHFNCWKSIYILSFPSRIFLLLWYCFQEECEEYRQKVKYGFYKRPTIVSFLTHHNLVFFSSGVWTHKFVYAIVTSYALIFLWRSSDAFWPIIRNWGIGSKYPFSLNVCAHICAHTHTPLELLGKIVQYNSKFLSV